MMIASYLSPTGSRLIFTIISRDKEHRCYQSGFICEEAWGKHSWCTFLHLLLPLPSLSLFPPSLPSSLSSLLPSPFLPFQWIFQGSDLISIHGFYLLSCSSQKPCCLSQYCKVYFLLSKTVGRGCWVSNGPDSNYNGPVASCTHIMPDSFKPFPLTIAFSIRDKDIRSFWVREQPDYSFVRKWCHLLLQSNWLTGLRCKSKSLPVHMPLLLSQWNPRPSKRMDMWSG